MKSSLRRIFRIFYRSFFAIILLCTFGVLLITPADAIQQAFRNGQPYNVFVIAGAYFLTFVFAALIWCTRWWTNKQALKSIPKSYIPVEKGDVTKKVRKMIVASLSRSATIAWDARPRSEKEPSTIVSAPDNPDAFAIAKDDSEKPEGGSRKRESKQDKHSQVVTIPPPKPVWGEIAHNGWSAPTSPDLPNLQYIQVILELPHLIEARAVSLAPFDTALTAEPSTPDVRAIGMLQRPPSMGLRDYIGHLTSIGTIAAPSVAMEFLASYEYARFAGRPLSEAQFRKLMKQFAEVLRDMKAIAPSVLAQLDVDEQSDTDGEASSLASSLGNRSQSPASLRTTSSQNSQGTTRTAPSRRFNMITTPTREYNFSTAPGTPVLSKDKHRNISLSPSPNIFSGARRSYTSSISSSGSSLRSTSQGSVIRLSNMAEGSHLPYTLSIPTSRP